MKLNLRIFGAIAVLATAIGAGPAPAAGYPTKPVKVIVPFAPAGPTDVMARLIFGKLSEKLGQQFYIENRPGAGGNIGTMEAARSAPDGYTILVASSSYVVNPYFLWKMAMMALAGLNMMYFHFITYRTVEHWDRDASMPAAVKVAAALSILFWIAVVFFGRAIGFTLGIFY